MKILITGYSGFVGKNVKNYFSNKFYFYDFDIRNQMQCIPPDVDIIMHFAGKAHDSKSIANASEYYFANTELTKNIYDKFLTSNASVFITLSSVKAVADSLNEELTEDVLPNPKTHYGKSKLFAEKYISSKIPASDKRVYILRPCMIHGPGNKGNLNFLNKIIIKNIPWPLGAYENKRSFCSIQNLCFILNELIFNITIPNGIYNVADDIPLSTNDLVKLFSITKRTNTLILKLPKSLIKFIVTIGDFIKLPFNSESLEKLTENYIVNNNKIKNAMGKQLPVDSTQGLIITLKSFLKNAK